MNAGSIEAAGAALAYTDNGAGPALVTIHDVGRPEPVPGLSGRVVSYARRGYGGSSAPEGYRATTVEEQAEDLVALVHGVGAAPALLVGIGFGALVALDVAKRHAGLVRGLVLVEPPLFQFVPEATQVIAEQRSAMEVALRAEGPAAAITAFLGEPAPDVAPAAFFADYAGMSSWPVTRRELRAITLPVVLLTRPGAPPHVSAAADALAGFLPLAERVRDGDVAAVVNAR